jgi:ribosomal-protein-serine acetyltransferase
MLRECRSDGQRCVVDRNTSSFTPAADITLRPYAVADALDVCQAVHESLNELMPWMPWCHPNYALQDSRTWLEGQVKAFRAGTAFEFAIVSPDGRYLGGCGVNDIGQVNRRGNIGYWVRTSEARRGVATAAVRLAYQWAMENTNLIRLEILIAVGNRASQRVAEKAGAVREGILRNRLLLRGEAHDAVMFSLIR